MTAAALEAASPSAVAQLALRLGRLLLVNGADTERTQDRVVAVVAHFGLTAHLLVTAEGLLVTVQGAEDFRTRIGPHIPAMAVDMAQLILIEQLIDDVLSGSVALEAIELRLDVISDTATGYPAALVITGVAVTAASLTRLFGGDWPVAAAAFVAGLVSTMLRRHFAARKLNAIAAAFLTALTSGLVGAVCMRAAPGSSPVLCLVAAGMILVPGVPLLNGIRDLVAGHADNGVVRLTLGSATVLSIGFALFLAAAIAGDQLPVGSAPGSLPIAQDVLFAALAAIGYATLFNVPMRAVWACVVCGMASHGLRTALEVLGLDLASASFLGAAAATLIARIAAAFYRVPPVTFAFPGVVAMIPGSYAFRAAIGGLLLMHEGAAASPTLVAETLSLVVTAVLVTVAIAVGIVLVLAIHAPSFHRSTQET